MTDGIDPTLRTADFAYDLPAELIAQTPVEPRDSSRLLVLDRQTGDMTHSTIENITAFLRAGDVVVANNSRVIHARLRARRASTGGYIELLLLKRDLEGLWEALARPARRLRAGDLLVAQPRDNSALPRAPIRISRKAQEGLVHLQLDPLIESHLDAYGAAPLPPYITTPLADPERYQTVYATIPGSAAAPTAGLHFSDNLIGNLNSACIEWVEVTLHIGLDTFRPVTSELVADHRIHSEWCSVSDRAAGAVQRAMAEDRRVIALGTTAARTLETAGNYWQHGRTSGFSTATSVFITPGYQWQVVDGLITNFHLPRSTLLMMVSAFAGRERILAAYQEAIQQRYRFYSFGDAMLIV